MGKFDSYILGFQKKDPGFIEMAQISNSHNFKWDWLVSDYFMKLFTLFAIMVISFLNEIIPKPVAFMHTLVSMGIGHIEHQPVNKNSQST